MPVHLLTAQKVFQSAVKIHICERGTDIYASLLYKLNPAAGRLCGDSVTPSSYHRLN